MEARRWYPGFRGKNPKGEFVVLRRTEGGYVVQYESGSWRGKIITMPEAVGDPTHELETLNLTKDQKEEVLDLFYNEYSKEYDSIYNYLLHTTNKEPTTIGMIEVLRFEYPPLFQVILNKYFNR